MATEKVIKTLDGELMTDEIRPLRTTLYGEGVFETFRYKGRLPKTIEKHYNRLKKGAECLSIPIISLEDYIEYIEESLDIAEKENLGEDLYIKTVLLSEGGDYYALVPYKSHLLVIIKPYKQPKSEISLTIAPFRVHSSDPLLRIKSTNFERNVLAKRYAVQNGYDDAIFLNERGEITETTSANIYWIKGNTLYTPAVECGLLEGITREVILKQAKEQGFNVVEGRFGLRDLANADYIFVSNALNGIIKVKKFDILALKEQLGG
jgi:4-amino-4-deoxychorismate lyase